MRKAKARRRKPTSPHAQHAEATAWKIIEGILLGKISLGKEGRKDLAEFVRRRAAKGTGGRPKLIEIEKVAHNQRALLVYWPVIETLKTKRGYTEAQAKQAIARALNISVPALEAQLRYK